MTAPVEVGLCRDKDHRYYWNGDGPLVSITTAIRAVDKSGPLIGWAQRETALAAVRNHALVGQHLATHRYPDETCPACMAAGTTWVGAATAAATWLKRMPGYKRDKAKDIGTRVHQIAEAIAHGQSVPLADEEVPYVTAYQKWEREWQPRYLASEYMVCNLSHRYAGTGDLVVEMAGSRWRLDTKTSEIDLDGKPKGPYVETALQLAAAHYAEFSGRPGDPKKYRVPAAELHGVLALRGDGTYAVVPYDVTPDTFEAFLAAKRLWDWLQGPAKSVVGQSIQRVEAAA